MGILRIYWASLEYNGHPYLYLGHDCNLYESLKQIYTFTPIPPQLTGDDRLSFAITTGAQRKELLDGLDDLTNHLAQGNSINFYEGPASDFTHQFSNIQKAIQQNCGKTENITHFLSIPL